MARPEIEIPKELDAYRVELQTIESLKLARYRLAMELRDETDAHRIEVLSRGLCVTGQALEVSANVASSFERITRDLERSAPRPALPANKES